MEILKNNKGMDGNKTIEDCVSEIAHIRATTTIAISVATAITTI